MPARRDMLTGRLTFLHRSWGPLEPFDNAFPELLHKAGIYSHLVTDHFHYWEDGGATYHNRYDSYEFIRGQEGDRWKAMVQPHWERLRENVPRAPVHAAAARRTSRKTSSTASSLSEEEDFPSVSASTHGFDFLDRNRDADNWLLQIETFDPHEPFHAPGALQGAVAPAGTGRSATGRATAASTSCRRNARRCAPTTMRDRRALRPSAGARCSTTSTRTTMWKDTALDRDHRPRLPPRRARLLGQEPDDLYEEIAHIPLFVHDPGAERGGQRMRRRSPRPSTSCRRSSTSSASRRAPEMRGRSLLAARGRPGRARGGALRLFRRRGERHRRAVHLFPLSTDL